ncbi:MAG: hypothetical protein L7U68_05680 [Flavobacteriaceae bacterium]|nr:hypothetical protein [Flavobacteriaceae bacterium]
MKRLLLTIFIALGTIGFAQEVDQQEETIDSLAPSIKRFSVGLKIGVPNIAGLSLEGVTPLLDNRIAPFVDFSGFDVKDAETEIGLSYTEFGTNVYFGNRGKGAYAGISFGNLSTDLTFYENLDGGGRGKGSIGLDIKSTNLKFGIKTGGRFYFRFEVGYGLTSDVPDDITVTLTEIGGNGTETDTFEVPTIPGVGTNGILLGNFGFGLSF